MYFAARQRPDAQDFACDSALIDALNAAVVAAVAIAPMPVIEHSVRKWVGPQVSPDEAAPLVNLSGALASVLYLFTPSLSGARPIERLARAASAKGGVEARAFGAMAASKFAIFRVEAWGGSDLATARDCVTGATYRLVCESLDPVLAGLDVATRLCPLGGDVYWPMGPIAPVGEGRAARFPTRPGKGLINESHVAAQIYAEYVRSGAPFGVAFGFRRPQSLLVSYADEALDDWALGMRERGQGTEPSGEALSALRGMASIRRVAVALSSSAELAEAGVADGAAIYRAAARVQIEALAERMRVGSGLAANFEDLRRAVGECLAPQGLTGGAAALFDALVRQVRPPGAGPAAQDDGLARVIERIRALRQKTVELGCTEQEALLAAEKVADLLERYGLTLSEIELRRQACEGFGFDTGRKTSAPIDDAFRAVAHFCDCRCWSESGAHGGLRQVFFGLPADVEAARFLKEMVAAAFATETAAFKRSALYRDEAAAGRRAMVKSFEIGLGGGIGQKLVALKAAREQAASRSTGRDLMIVKRSLLDEEMEKLGLTFRSKASRRKRVIVDAYEEGVVAAHRFEVNEKIR